MFKVITCSFKFVEAINEDERKTIPKMIKENIKISLSIDFNYL